MKAKSQFRQYSQQKLRKNQKINKMGCIQELQLRAGIKYLLINRMNKFQMLRYKLLRNSEHSKDMDG